MKASSHIPRATYRLQLNRDFTFEQASAIVPYLSALGISHCYISPCLKARPGSMHGYDIVDHNSLNPEIGSQQDFDAFVAALRRHSMGLILDIVPNHMGVMGSDNAWWLDVLENGEASAYACFFDIDWHPLKEELHGKVLVPVLHDHYGAVLESGELKLVFYPERGEFDICYRTHRFPVNPREYPRILERAANLLAKGMEAQNPDLLEFQSLITAFGHLPRRTEASSELITERNRDKEIHKRRLAELCARSPEISAGIRKAVESINGAPSDPSSFNDLHELIKVQAFRLANWRVASDDINYRRFFDTNDLAALCMENEKVFEATHRLVLKFVSEGKVDGLRIDHPDGLFNPAEYFRRLQQALHQHTSNQDEKSSYVVIEKILTGNEALPRDWPVCGTTGYDFSNLVNGLFVDPGNSGRLERIYWSFIGDEIDFDDLAYRSRKLIIRTALVSELNVLAIQLTRIALAKRHTCDFTLNNLRDTITEVVASFPVYRTYVSSAGVSESDSRYIRMAIEAAKWRSPAGDTSVFDFLSEVLLARIADGHDAAYRKAVTAFAMKFQQFTSPVMAKGLEDTAFYRYNRLTSLNDVGSDLQRFGTTVSEFHAASQERCANWPHTMLGTATHDSKRSEDVRARINVLSEIPALWRFHLSEWKKFNREHKSQVKHKPAPSPNDEYLLYQTLIGAWPSAQPEDDSGWAAFTERIENYMLKAIREAKQNTSWINRNAPYEDAVSAFVRALLKRADENRFLRDFIPFQQQIAGIGVWNSLSQTLLKLTSPGVPDIYQGNELFDFSLVDPDNRRPVDYELRKKMFHRIRQSARTMDSMLLSEIMQNPVGGELKMHLISKTLCFRKQTPELFENADYVPLRVEGASSKHVIAFARRLEQRSMLVIVPRLIATLLDERQIPPIGKHVWGDTSLQLPCSCSKNYRNIFTEERTEVSPSEPISISDLVRSFPVAVCVSD